MPTYGYECLSCDNNFEVFQSIKDDPMTTCESCGGSLRKRVYPVGIAFKGSGFYVNDYAGKSAAKPETSESAGGETKSESKPEAVKPEASKSEVKPTETKVAAAT